LIIFKKLRYKNLLSTGNVFTEINLNTHSTTLIVGENGAGKSTILDALSFALFGKPFREVNKGQLINSINGKGLLVEIEFQIGNKSYLVQRGSKPNIFNIFQDGTLINNDASAGDYQDMLDKQILKINHKTFSQIVVLGSASFVPFMQLKASNRREVIEDLLDIQIFTTMNTLLKDKISANKSSITDADYTLKGLAEKIELEKKHLQTLQTNNDEQIEAKRLKIAEHEASIAMADEDIQRYQEELSAYAGIDDMHAQLISNQTKLNTILHQLMSKSRELDKDIAFFSTHNDCPVCQQGIDHTFKTGTIDDKKKKREELIAAMHIAQSRVHEIVDNLKLLQNNFTARDSWKSLIKDRLSDTTFWHRLIGEMQGDIQQLATTQHIEDNTNRLADMRAQLKSQIVNREQLGKQRMTLEMAAVLLKDTGIKTKIIRQYIPVINKLINKYLASMDFFVNFELDENFEEKIKSRFRDEFSYASFSEGEKSRLDLALLFTWRSISRLRNSTSTNLLILDEVFDGSLDATGNEELLKILDTLVDGNNVFVISHKTDVYLDKFQRVLRFEKQKNFSTMIEL
jgi:DNA repair exonuclease SbcCD ATPase subunit